MGLDSIQRGKQGKISSSIPLMLVTCITHTMPCMARLIISLAACLPLLLVNPSQAESAPSTPPLHQDAAEVAAHVTEFLQEQAGAYAGQLQAHVTAPRTDRLAPCDRLQAATTTAQTLRPRMSVQVRCLSPSPWTLHVQANLTLQGFHYIATRTINPGETLTLDDLHGIEGDLLRLPRDAATDPSQIIGQLAALRIRNGAVIKSGALRDPASIQRGQHVRTEARGPGFHLTGEGQALQGGPPGSNIQIRSSSGQIINGIVIDATTVQIPL